MAWNTTGRLGTRNAWGPISRRRQLDRDVLHFLEPCRNVAAPTDCRTDFGKNLSEKLPPEQNPANQELEESPLKDP